MRLKLQAVCGLRKRQRPRLQQRRWQQEEALARSHGAAQLPAFPPRPPTAHPQLRAGAGIRAASHGRAALRGVLPHRLAAGARRAGAVGAGGVGGRQQCCRRAPGEVARACGAGERRAFAAVDVRPRPGGAPFSPPQGVKLAPACAAIPVRAFPTWVIGAQIIEGEMTLDALDSALDKAAAGGAAAALDLTTAR
jgi:hypothetical protein